MTRTVADRMVESAGRGRVGREREIGALLAAATADEPPFLVAFVHGPGGIGKSHLVRRLLDALPAPVRGLYLDGRDVEPTPRGLRRALGQALGSTSPDPEVAALARALAARPTVLVIDTYEALGLLDAWLRT
ncbi:MAG TPA: ATP-binding protein, partial [Pseudonocardia sp.]|nr:ATP-binding protein [Pseudonocardia sp.]